MKILKSHRSFGGRVESWEHDSDSTRSKMKFSTFRPGGSAPTTQAVIFLAGLTCTDENFITKAGALPHFAKHNLMLVCPDTSPRGLNLPGEHESYDFGSGAGFYVDATTPDYRDHYRMYSYITQEMRSLLREEFGVEHISLMGHSMGGHGALVMGLREPDIFSSVSAFAPITHPTRAPWGQKAFSGYLGENEEDWRAYDATELLKAGKRHPRPLKIDQGMADEYLEKQLLLPDLIAEANESGQTLVLNPRDGYDHSYYFIASFVADHIAFHARALSEV